MELIRACYSKVASSSLVRVSVPFCFWAASPAQLFFLFFPAAYTDEVAELASDDASILVAGGGEVVVAGASASLRACVPVVSAPLGARSRGGTVVFRTIPRAFSFPRFRLAGASVRLGIVGIRVLSGAGAVTVDPFVSAALVSVSFVVPSKFL